MKDRILNCISESISVKESIFKSREIVSSIQQIVDHSVALYKEKAKILLCGNGGSAADAQHIAAELSGRFLKDRKALFAEALHVNSSYVTAVANDYGFDNIYSRMIEAAGRKSDMLIAISTSGNSKNVINALIKAKEVGMLTVGLSGKKSAKMDSICDIMIKVPSDNTARIQESHIMIGHIICELIEEYLF